MTLKLKEIKFEYLAIFVMVVFAGLMVSIYNLSVVVLLISILFLLISFKYFNQILFLLILYIPFQIALNIAPGIDLASGRFLILYFFVVWIIKSLAEKRLVIRFNLQTFLIVVFLALAIFSISQAWEMERALRKILVFLSIFPLYFVITSFEMKKKYLFQIINTLFLSGFILSLIGIIQFLLQFIVGISPVINFWGKYIAPIFYGHTFGAEVISNPSWLVNIQGTTVLRAFSLFPDSHMFAFYLGLLIPVALAILLVDKKLIEKNKQIFFNTKFVLIVFLVMFFALLLSFSRGGYLGMLTGIASVILLMWRKIDFSKKIYLGIISFSFLLMIIITNQAVLNRFVSSFDFQEGSNSERIKNWQQGWEVFSDNVFTGIGIGNYSIYLYPTIEYRTPVYAHNLYLDIGAEMGIFSLLTWFLLIGITVWQLFNIGQKTKDVFLTVVSFGLIGSFVWFSVHSFFDTAIYSPTILTIFIIILSLSSLIIGKKKKVDLL